MNSPKRRLAGRALSHETLLAMEVGTPLYWHRGDTWLPVEYLGTGQSLRDGTPRYAVQHKAMEWTADVLASELRPRSGLPPCPTCGAER